MKKIYIQYLITILLIGCMCIFTSCYTQREYQYYSDRNNFITVTAELIYFNNVEDESSVYLSFSGLPEVFSDNCFKIIEENWKIIEDTNTFAFSIGDKITFTTAPKYFGDGYIMPIVAVSIDGNTLLDFEQGYSNFMKTYE